MIELIPVCQHIGPPPQRYTDWEVSTGPDTYPNNFKCWVEFIDNKTGQRMKRRGYGRFIGNFSPIWITIGGVNKQITEWERVEI